MKEMTKLILLIFLLQLPYNLHGQSLNSAKTSSQNNLLGLNISVGKKFKLIEGIKSFDESNDSIFIKPDIFFNQFNNNSELDFSYGVGFKVGYQNLKNDYFVGLGLVRSKFAYELNNITEDLSKNAFFIQIGTEYNLNPNIGFNINSKLYDIEFRDASDNDIKANNLTLTFGISVNL
jgi:hypothetical protein